MTPTLHLKQFGKYEIIRKLGRSMTDVYLALDPETNRRVVLKIVEHAHDAYTQLVMEAERRGAAIQKQLHDLDPRILEIYDYGEANGCFFVAMEYVEGKSLADILTADRRLDPIRAARYAIEICSQLQTLHSFQADIDGRKRAVVHGDIKPSNIQIGPHDEVRLLDFGIAKSITNTHNLTHHNLGSPAYCSPERVKTAQVDQHADLWGAVVSLYEMVAGMPPYQAQSTRRLENLIQSRRPPRALPEGCPPALKAIIGKALAADLNRRYASAVDFENDLRLFLEKRRTAAEVETTPAWDANATIDRSPPPRRRTRNRRLRLILQEVNQVVWAVLAGLVIGLILFVPAGYVYRLWSGSEHLRQRLNYADRTPNAIEADWKEYQSLRAARVPDSWSPVGLVRQSLHANLVAAATEIIESYRNSSETDPSHFDWAKAKLCLDRALELDPNDIESQGKLDLIQGYVDSANAKSHFEKAVSEAPRLPDPHLGLARIEIYQLHNVGAALAEFHAAERLGFHPGPREFEEQADGYLSLAEQELHQWQHATTKSTQTHYFALMQRDLNRARDLYEPITGYSNVSQNLQQLYNDEAKEREIIASRQPHPKPHYARRRRWP